MSNVVNLRQARKQADRAAKRTKADANAARHGVSKADKAAAAKAEAGARRHLDQHRIAREDEP